MFEQVVERTLEVWDAESGDAVATLPLLYGSKSLATHPWSPWAACGDLRGALFQVELMGIEYGPIIVTATGRDEGPTIRCPACFQEHTLDTAQLGSEMTCPTPSCGLRLRVNPFLLNPASRKRGWWSKVRRRLG